MSCDSAIAPIQLPLTNVTVTSNGLVNWRGVEIGIGSPQQIVSLQIGMMEKDMFVFNAAGCNETEEYCAALYAGIVSLRRFPSPSDRMGALWKRHMLTLAPRFLQYDGSASSTFNRVTQSQWNGTSDDSEIIVPDANYVFFTEHVEYGANGSADGFPLYMNAIETRAGEFQIF
jgi:hypothetical protein